MTLLTLEAVTRHVALPDRPPLEILRGIDLVVDAGDRVSIVGRSGSGKSTLLNILGLLDQPTTGRMRFDDEPVLLMSARRRDRVRALSVGFVFQQFHLIEGLSALENVQMPLLYGSSAHFWRRERLARAMLDRVALGHRADAPVTTLSGGEQQRVAIARALVRSPRLILADEPTGALDLETGARIMDLLEDVARDSRAALVTITHDVNVAARSERMHRLDAGVLAPAEHVAEVAA
ncbi:MULTISPECIES: ABC transporter ATP-binding protein [unclassified Agrococcus]|uniref:ABC transporter ATP-binding protein n=1 Tax=unclassified Agrococcus TaxID=2615065 RepID=UPI00360FA6D1